MIVEVEKISLKKAPHLDCIVAFEAIAGGPGGGHKPRAALSTFTT